MRLGIDIPSDTPTDLYALYSVVSEQAPDEAHQSVLQACIDHYTELDLTSKRHSVTEYVEANEATVRAILDCYIPSLAAAVHEGKNNKVIQNFAAEVVRKPSKNMNPELIKKLRTIADSHHFTPDDAAIVKDVICYAINERLRGGLKRLLKGDNLQTIARRLTIEQAGYDALPPDARLHAITSDMGRFIHVGVEAGRNPPGCSGGDGMSMVKEVNDLASFLKPPSNPLTELSAGAEDDFNKLWHRGKIFENTKCQSCEEIKDRVGACHICKSCVDNTRKRQQAWIRRKRGEKSLCGAIQYIKACEEYLDRKVQKIVQTL